MHFTLKPNPQHRVYRIQLMNDRMVQLDRQIHSSADLEKALLGLEVKNVYESVNEFLDPKNCRGIRSPYQPVVLNSLVFIDVDNHGASEAIKVVEFMKELKRYSLWKIVQTSEHSLHLYYFDSKKDFLKLHPRDRIDYLKRSRSRLQNKILKAGIKIDPLMNDPWRVSRTIGSVNGNKNNFVCREVDITILESLTAMTEESGSPLTKVQAETRPRISVPSFHSYKFITNFCEGTDNQYVFYAEIEKERNYKSLVRRLQKAYNIGTCYIIELPHCRGLLSLKVLSGRRVEKIMKAAKALNLNQFMKYKAAWIKTSSIRDSKSSDDSDTYIASAIRPSGVMRGINPSSTTGRRTEESDGDLIHEVKLIESIYGEATGKWSRPHTDLVVEMGGSGFHAYDLVGNEKNKIYVCSQSEAHT